jgi:hypothetical protein
MLNESTDNYVRQQTSTGATNAVVNTMSSINCKVVVSKSTEPYRASCKLTSGYMGTLDVQVSMMKNHFS